MSGQWPAHLAGIPLRHAENGLAWPSETASPSPGRAGVRLAGDRSMHRRDPGRGFEIVRPGPESRRPASPLARDLTRAPVSTGRLTKGWRYDPGRGGASRTYPLDEWGPRLRRGF